MHAPRRGARHRHPHHHDPDHQRLVQRRPVRQPPDRHDPLHRPTRLADRGTGRPLRASAREDDRARVRSRSRRPRPSRDPNRPSPGPHPDSPSPRVAPDSPAPGPKPDSPSPGEGPDPHPHVHHPGRQSPRPRRATQTRGARQARPNQLRPRPRRIRNQRVGRRRQEHHRRQQRDRRATAEQHRPVHDQLVDNRMTPSTNQHPPLPNPGTRRPRHPQRTRTAGRTTSSRSPTRDDSADHQANRAHPRRASTSSRHPPTSTP